LCYVHLVCADYFLVINAAKLKRIKEIDEEIARLNEELKVKKEKARKMEEELERKMKKASVVKKPFETMLSGWQKHQG